MHVMGKLYVLCIPENSITTYQRGCRHSLLYTYLLCRLVDVDDEPRVKVVIHVLEGEDEQIVLLCRAESLDTLAKRREDMTRRLVIFLGFRTWIYCVVRAE